MKNLSSLLCTLFTVLCLTFLCLTVLWPLSTVSAATSNPSPASPGYTPLVLPIMGTYSGARTGLVKFTAPAKYSIVSASVNARGVTGTDPTLKVYLKSGPFTNYSGTVKTLTAGTTTLIADEATVAVDLVTGGTSPQWRDLTLFILLKRL